LSENNTEKEFTYIIFAKENNLLFTIPIVKIRYATTDMAKFKVVKSQCSCHEQLRDKIEKLHTPPVGNLAPFQREISFSFPMRMLAFHCLPFLVLLLPLCWIRLFRPFIKAGRMVMEGSREGKKDPLVSLLLKS